MSFLVATPELLESTAQTLATIRSALSQATNAAASPTTGILAAGADEVSAAISQLFGSYGTEFQALSAQAASFHDEFVGLMNAGASAYAGAEATTTQGLLGNLGTFGSLITNTTANLQSINSALVADPSPILSQLLANQSVYEQTIATGFANAVQNLPAGLANAPTNIENAFQGLLSANPGAVLQGIVNNQVGYANLIGSSLQTAGYHIVTGFESLPASFQAANQAFAVGDITGGLKLIGGGFLNPFFSGFSTVTSADSPLVTVTPTGALGDLLPIFSIPGQMAQNFTNLLPANSIPAQLSQNFTNVVKTLTNTSVTSTVNIINDPNGPFGLGVSIDAHMGLPLALAIDAIGGPVNGLNALGTSLTTFASAVQTGDALGAVNAVFNAPAAIANGFLNGQTALPLSLDVELGGVVFPTTLNIPLDGLLVPAAPYSALVDGSNIFGPGIFLNSTVTGTPIGGILPSLLEFLPRSIAAAIGAPSPDFPPLGL